MTTTILIPAAGASSRMQGQDKLVQPVDGMPLLRRQSIMATAIADQVLVALPATDHPFYAGRAAALAKLDVKTHQSADSALGLGGTIRCAIPNLSSGTSKLMILLPDLVDLTAEDLTKVLKAAIDQPARGVAQDGTPGHPVVFPATLFAKLGQINAGDDGPRSVLKSHPPLAVPLPGAHATRDLDTPKDWDMWRAEQRRTTY